MQKMHRKDKPEIEWIDQPTNGGWEWDVKKGGGHGSVQKLFRI